MSNMTQVDDVDLGRECLLKGLCVHLNEDPEDLLREFVAEDEDVILRSIEGITVGLYVVKHNSTMRPEDIGIVLEGQQVLTDVDNIALAATMLFGLMYAMNLNYPPKLKCTFEVLQKSLMELDGNMLSKKAQAFKNKLFE